MPIGVLFWVIFIIWILLSGWGWRSNLGEPSVWGGGLILAFLLGLLGWHVFGPLLR